MRKTIESEKTLEKNLRHKVKELGGWALKLPAIHVTGLPDRLCLFPGGKVIFIEVKTTGKKPTKIQKRIHEKLRELGFRVEVVDSSETLNLIIP